jgi:hypothetical protein
MRSASADRMQSFPNRTEGSVKKHWYKVLIAGVSVKLSNSQRNRTCTTLSGRRMRLVRENSTGDGGIDRI